MDIASFLEGVTDRKRADFMETFERLRKDCGSPIEELILAALLDRNDQAPPELPIVQFPRRGAHGGTVPYEPIIMAELQAQVGDYLADFLFRIVDKDLDKTVVVECDGHEYHERTKQQAAHDRRRDRYMTASGIAVLRFTGSEIWKDPAHCALQVFATLYAILARTPESTARFYRSEQEISHG